MRVHAEVNFGGGPLVASLSVQSGDQARQRVHVGEDGRDSGAAFEFLVHAFDGVAGAHAFLMCHWKGEDRKTLGDVFLHPGGELGGAPGKWATRSFSRAWAALRSAQAKMLRMDSATSPRMSLRGT